MKIGVQLFSIRKYLETAEEFARAAKTLSDIGFRYVETAGFGGLDAKQFKNILDDNGLKVCSSHIGIDKILQNTRKMVDEQLLLNTTCCNCSWPGTKSFDINGILQTAEQIAKAAEILKENGLVLGYHNHGIEFAKCGCKTWLELILENSKGLLTAQPDTYWIQYGGGDPAYWISRYSKRLNSIHFKDMAISQDNQQIMVAVGTGNLNWENILLSANNSSAKYAIVEMDFSHFFLYGKV